jgi:hypothetical protein
MGFAFDFGPSARRSCEARRYGCKYCALPAILQWQATRFSKFDLAAAVEQHIGGRQNSVPQVVDTPFCGIR